MRLLHPLLIGAHVHVGLAAARLPLDLDARDQVLRQATHDDEIDVVLALEALFQIGELRDALAGVDGDLAFLLSRGNDRLPLLC